MWLNADITKGFGDYSNNRPEFIPKNIILLSKQEVIQARQLHDTNIG